MAHGITQLSNGSFSSVHSAKDGAGWHGLGTPIPISIANDPAAIAALCGAAYTVRTSQVLFIADDGSNATADGRFVVYRTDNNRALNVVSEQYKFPQPVEYFEAYRDALAANNLSISHASVLQGGRLVYVTAKIADDVTIGTGGDTVQRFFCIGGGYDGTRANFGFLSNLRTVCNNTLNANLNGSASGQIYRVTHRTTFDGAALASAMGAINAELRIEADVFNSLAGYRMAQTSAARFFCDVLDVDPADLNRKDRKGEPVVSTRTRNMLEALASAYQRAPGQALNASSAWSALNAVTYWIDHARSARDTEGDGAQKARFASANFGTGAALKKRALMLAMSQAGIGINQSVAA